MGILVQIGLWVLSLFAKGAQKAPTPDDVIVTDAPAAARQQGVDQQALAQARETIKAAETQHATEAKAAAAVGAAQRRVVQESDADLDHDPDAHYRD